MEKISFFFFLENKATGKYTQDSLEKSESKREFFHKISSSQVLLGWDLFLVLPFEF